MPVACRRGSHSPRWCQAAGQARYGTRGLGRRARRVELGERNDGGQEQEKAEQEAGHPRWCQEHAARCHDTPASWTNVAGGCCATAGMRCALSLHVMARRSRPSTATRAAGQGVDASAIGSEATPSFGRLRPGMTAEQMTTAGPTQESTRGDDAPHLCSAMKHRLLTILRCTRHLKQSSPAPAQTVEEFYRGRCSSMSASVGRVLRSVCTTGRQAHRAASARRAWSP